MAWFNGKSLWLRCSLKPVTPQECTANGTLAEQKADFPQIRASMNGTGFPIPPTSLCTPRCRVSLRVGFPRLYVLDSKRGEKPKEVRPYNLDYRPLIDRDLTDRAIAFMKSNTEAEKPFFIYLPYTATHFPTMPHPDFSGNSGKGLWGEHVDAD